MTVKDKTKDEAASVEVERLTAALAKAEAALERLKRLESSGLMANDIAHEFNNILFGIMGKASLAKEYLAPGDKLFGLLGDIEDAANRAKSISRRLLSFSKEAVILKEAVSIAELLSDTAKLVLKGAEYECSIDDDIAGVFIDPAQVGSAINNVILNAAQASGEGGLVKIGAENVTVTGSVGGSGVDAAPLSIEDGDYVRITVEDSGAGVPASELSKIFEPFYTTKEKASGLGLALAYSVIRKHGGYIGVDSAEGGGALFSIYLPACEREAPDEATPASGPRAARVLVLDDDEVVREVSAEMLELIGFRAEFAVDGEELLEKYKGAMGSADPFGLVIMDLSIPEGMGGAEAIKELLAIDPEAKAIVSSGYSVDPVMVDYEAHGFKGAICKPYTVEEFKAVVRSVLG